MITYSKYITSSHYIGHSSINCDQDFKWGGYIYLARHKNKTQLYTKIGYTMNLERLKQRDRELQQQNNLFIEHIFSVPNPPYIESALKKNLTAFIDKHRINLPGKSEYIFTLPFEVLKKVVKLYILVFFIENGFVINVPNTVSNRLKPLFSGISYICIIADGQPYRHDEVSILSISDNERVDKPVIVSWGKDDTHPEWQHRLFMGVYKATTRRQTCSIQWTNDNYAPTTNIPLQWVYINNVEHAQETSRTLNLDDIPLDTLETKKRKRATTSATNDKHYKQSTLTF